MPRITGFILLPESAEALHEARLHIRVENVGRADAPARLLGSCSIDGITAEQRLAGQVPFALDVAAPGRGACAIRAHLDVDRDGVVGPGDYVTAEHISVPMDDLLTPVRVALEQVRRR